MSDYKHICDFNYCKIHQTCLYKNAATVLRNHGCSAKVGHEVNANIITCYQKELDTSVYGDAKVISITKDKKELCENPKCKSGNPESVVRHNNDINLCKSCNDLIHYHQSNHELARYFNSKNKIIKLLGCIRELEKETNEKPTKVIRCANIYCGTTLEMTIHHLIPKPHRAGISGKIPRMDLCDTCHKRVHRLKSPLELATHYNTKKKVIELLAGDREFIIPRFFLNESVPVMAVG